MRRLLLLPLAAWTVLVFATGLTVAATRTIDRHRVEAAATDRATPDTTAPTRAAGPPSTRPLAEPTTTVTTTTTTRAPAVPTTAPTTTVAPAPTTTGTAPRGVARTQGEVLLVWTSGGLPPGFAEQVTALPAVTAHTTVLADLVRLVGSRDAGGTVVDAAPGGWAWPIDAFAVDPASYGSFQDGADAATIAALRPGGAVLTRTSATLRRIGVGGVLAFGPSSGGSGGGPGGELTVTGIVEDVHGGGAEVLVHPDDAGRLGIGTERFVLLTDTDRAAVEDQIRSRTPAGEHLSLRSESEAPYLRHGDRVDPQVLVKATFGEFLFQDAGGRDIRMEQAWIDANIVRAQVPLLGTITCHRAVVPLVRAAMTELEQSGRGDVVDATRYAGCWNPRRIAAGEGLSRHTWGLALDLNIGADPRGTFESQDPALVAAFESRDFGWGGRWEYPDPGHYEKRA